MALHNKDLSILRSEKVSKETSKISKDPKVRNFFSNFKEILETLLQMV